MASSWGGSWGTSWADSWGVLSGAGNVTLSGKRANTAIGLLKPVLEITLVGQAATTAYGALTPSTGNDVSVALTGLTAGLSAGMLAPGLEIPLFGQWVTTGAGAFRFDSTTVTRNLWVVTLPDTVFAPTVDEALFTCVRVKDYAVLDAPQASMVHEYIPDLFARLDAQDVWAVAVVEQETSAKVGTADLYVVTDIVVIFVTTGTGDIGTKAESVELMAA